MSEQACADVLSAPFDLMRGDRGPYTGFLFVCLLVRRQPRKETSFFFGGYVPTRLSTRPTAKLRSVCIFGTTPLEVCQGLPTFLPFPNEVCRTPNDSGPISTPPGYIQRLLRHGVS